MTKGAAKIAIGVVVAVMGAVLVPTLGVMGFVQILAGGLLVYGGVLRLKKESQP